LAVPAEALAKAGGDFKPNLEPLTKRLETRLHQAILDLKAHLTTVSVNQIEDFHKSLATIV
jgi:hypothetical protein